MSSERIEHITAELKTTFFNPKTWEFWRALIIAGALCSMLGHWLEIPYCAFMSNFGIVADDYAVITDPWFVPYYCYGWGALGMTLFLEPLKEIILHRCKTLWGAILLMFLLTIVIAAVLETVIGLIVNQPDAAGKYPFWDNSQLPGNILGQGWIVNDFFIGLVAIIYLWGIFPAIWFALEGMGQRAANITLLVVCVFFGICCICTIWMFYLPSWLALLGL